MKGRIIALFIILGFLISLSIYEVIQVSNIIVRLEEDINELYDQYILYEDNISSLYDDVVQVEEKWDSKESTLSLMFNHKDLSVITDCLTKLKIYVKQNDYDNGLVEIELLKEYSLKNYSIMGFTYQNVL